MLCDRSEEGDRVPVEAKEAADVRLRVSENYLQYKSGLSFLHLTSGHFVSGVGYVTTESGSAGELETPQTCFNTRHLLRLTSSTTHSKLTDR